MSEIVLGMRVKRSVFDVHVSGEPIARFGQFQHPQQRSRAETMVLDFLLEKGFIGEEFLHAAVEGNICIKI